MSEHPSAEELVLHVSGDADHPEAVEAHLQECRRCRRESAEIRSLLRATREVEVPEPDSDFESRVWRRVRTRLSDSVFAPATSTGAAHESAGAAAAAGAGAAGHGRGRSANEADARVAWHRRLRDWLTPRRMVLVGSVAAMVAVAFLVGLLLPPPSGSPLVPADDGVRERILLVAVGDHLEQSQTVLVELVNAAGADGAVDVSPQQEKARMLLADNRLYRQSARLGGNRVVAELLEELERFLLEVAHGPGELQDEDLDWLRERITSRDLLFRVRVVEETVRREEIDSTAAGSVG